MSATHIHFDIYELIFHSLAEEEDFTTLRACSLVCGTLLPLTRKHIFAFVKLNIMKQPRIKKFMTLIEANGIGHYVCKLEYAIVNEDQMRLVLGKLKNLKSLRIYHHSGRACFADLVDQEARSTELQVVPPFPTKSVYLQEFSADYKSASVLVKARHPNGLQVVDFAELTTIRVEFDGKEDIDPIRTILIRAKRPQNIELRILRLSIPYVDVKLAKTLMGSIQSLKVLKLVFYGIEESEGLLSCLYRDLGAISGHSIMETLSIVVQVVVHRNSNLLDHWGLLDKVLNEKNAWLGLKEVSLLIYVSRSFQVNIPIAKQLEKLGDTQFPGLSASKTISFKFKFDDMRPRVAE
ncbi:hypothetical protein M413DRAFT_30118 [Hebeloma cylindrosporum]|uniref:F-box domain-containing protein n=1 Tax=Hebeloma cylindrosporum TaxID=76867 RepID=A0A0C2YC62_HEBCY|nr:hypothetical protein M413DRAFT_30118 [Hebeloma cylindrosporum h7]